MIRSHQITVLTVGSTGDLYPYCALALGLQQAGHRVKVATNANFEAFVCGLGLEFALIARDYRTLLSSELGQKHLQGELVKLIDDDLLKQQLTAEWLASAMTIATHDSVMQQKAAQLGRKMSRENGVEQAVSLIHQSLGLPQVEPPR